MMKANKYHSVRIQDISIKNVGGHVVVSGWVENIRDHGGVLFLDLRDTSATIQTVSNDDNLFKGIAKESCIRLEGTIRQRDEETYNERLTTGEVELLVEKLDILSPSLHYLQF